MLHTQLYNLYVIDEIFVPGEPGTYIYMYIYIFCTYTYVYIYISRQLFVQKVTKVLKWVHGGPPEKGNFLSKNDTHNEDLCMGISKNRGKTPKWTVKIMETPIF